MIAYPIGDPIGSHWVHPNRPRIARIGSVRIGSLYCVGHFSFPTYERPQPAPGLATTAAAEAMR